MRHSEVDGPPDDVDDHTSETGRAVERERHFLAAWEDRRIPTLSAYLRVRQFRRALGAPRTE